MHIDDKFENSTNLKHDCIIVLEMNPIGQDIKTGFLGSAEVDKRHETEIIESVSSNHSCCAAKNVLRGFHEYSFPRLNVYTR